VAELIHHHTFANGLTLLAERMPHVRSVSMNLSVRAGAAHDPDDRLGMASVLGELVMRGAGERDFHQLQLALDNLGLDYDHGVGPQTIRFSGSTLGRPPAVEQAGKHELTIPGTELVVQAKFLDGRAPNWAKTKQSRQALANWLTDPANPFFARAAVNRLWAYCFGLGLIDPIDEMVGTDAQPSHPKLLDHLARAFVRSGYDTKFLLEAITNSQAYQRSSRQTHPSQADASAFAKAALRGLSAEQLYDSLSVAIGLGNPTAPATNNPLNLGQPTGPRQEFLTRFTNLGERPTEVQTSILQALHLMNGQLVGDATSLENSRTLAAILEYPGFTTQQRIETLYLAALTRLPTATELGRMTQFMEAALAEVPADRRPMRQRQALADIFWALLNSSEFYLNH
jgi:hypothetical protein